jgi:hypothetical protein
MIKQTLWDVRAKLLVSSPDEYQVEPGSTTTPSWLQDVCYIDPDGNDPGTSILEHDASFARSSSEEEPSSGSASTGPSSTRHEDSVDQGLILESTSHVLARSGATKAYFDWALIDLEQSRWPVSPNLVTYPKGYTQPISGVVSESLLQSPLPVLVVTARSGVVEGLLHPSYAFFATSVKAQGYYKQLGQARAMNFKGHYRTSGLEHDIKLD